MVTRPVARLTVIVPSELAAGFRLAGTEVRESVDAEAAQAILASMLRDGDPGIVGVYAPYHSALDQGMLERCERATDPIVIPVPAGLGEGDASSQRARIAALLERAVGYHFTFSDEAP